MPLQYIIDGYNITNHPQFPRTRKNKDSRSALVDFIRKNRLTGSIKNKAMIVFDGYPADSFKNTDNSIEIVFSEEKSADERIKIIVTKSRNPKNIVVVSNDKDIQYSVRLYGAVVVTVEEFIGKKERLNKNSHELIKPELTHSLMNKINQELRQIWLK